MDYRTPLPPDAAAELNAAAAHDQGRPDLEAIAARAAACLPGPWAATRIPGSDDISVGMDDGSGMGHVARVASYLSDDAEFLAAAREDVPALLSEVDRLRGEMSERVAAARRERDTARREGANDMRERLLQITADMPGIDDKTHRALADEAHVLPPDPDACGATWTPHDRTYTCARPPGHKFAHSAADDAARWLDLDAHDDADALDSTRTNATR